MKKISLSAWLTVISLFFSMPAMATASILLLGDSVSASYGMKQEQGWVHLLNKKLASENKPYKIVNTSISGETTAGGLSRLPSILKNTKLDHVIIELGGNDGLRGYSPKVIKNNLLQMIELVQAQGIPVSLINIRITPNYGPRYTKMFEKVFSDLSEEKQVTLLPFFMEQVITDQKLMMDDGIHPNVDAQPIISDYVYEQLSDLTITIQQ
jgi:acyl-CoA thioesterase-1